MISHDTVTCAIGTFDFTLVPDTEHDRLFTRLSFTKVFHGGINGRSAGEMLGVRTDITGSAGYVAMERVTAHLSGRSGSFALQHFGSFNRGAKTQRIIVVPDSGTDELLGLQGRMTIEEHDGKHTYALHYAFESSPA